MKLRHLARLSHLSCWITREQMARIDDAVRRWSRRAGKPITRSHLVRVLLFRALTEDERNAGS